MKNKINEDLKQAMRDKDQTKLNVLRGLKTAFTNASLQKGNVDTELSESEIVQIVRKQLSQRRDSINQFVSGKGFDLSGKRFDLIVKEENEIEILKQYLPEELTDGDLELIVDSIISTENATTKKDMGRVIKAVVEHVNGRADNKRISSMVGGKLQ